MSEQQERPKPKRADTEVSSTAEDDPGYESRSRSQSRRRRRQNQRQRQTVSKAQAGNAKADSMAAVKEQPQEEQEQEHEDSPYKPRSQWLKNPAPQDTTEAQPFERIKPPSQSMDGPVTYARMMRGEIPWKGPPPTQPYETTQGVDAKGNDGKDPMDQDGLKLRIELNLDIEIELKASIHGDLTLALFIIIDEWKKTSVADRVMLSLVCKKFAAEISVRRSNIPRAVNPTSATAPKRQRLNFLQRLAPWFDNDAAQNNLEIDATEHARAEHRFEAMDKLIIVDEGWILCVSCLKYRQARVAMLDLNAQHYPDDPSIPGRWTRCLIRREDEARLGQRLSLDGVEANWILLPADKSKLPDYVNPKSKIKEAKKKIDTPKGAGKPKEKTDAPQSIASAADKGKGKGKAEGKAPEDLTGLEDCHYLPVDAYGERVGEVSLCPMHSFDPVRFIGM